MAYFKLAQYRDVFSTIKGCLNKLSYSTTPAMTENTPMSVKCVILKAGIIAPSRNTTEAAGFDIYLPETITIEPKEQKTIPCGFKLIMPPWLACQIISRSSAQKKNELSIYNGIIDSDYTGEINLLIKNLTNYPIIIKQNHRVAQFILMYIYSAQLDILGLDPEPAPSSIKKRGEAFGSTGH